MPQNKQKEKKNFETKKIEEEKRTKKTYFILYYLRLWFILHYVETFFAP